MKKVLKNLIKPALGIGVIAFLIIKGDLDPGLIEKAFVHRSQWVILGCLIFLGLTISAGIRWYILLRAGGINIPFFKIFSLHMIGIFFVSIIPGGTGGDLVKGYYVYHEEPEKKGIAISSIVVDRVVGLFGILVWALVGALANYQIVLQNSVLKTMTLFYGLVCLGFTLFILFCFTPWADKMWNNSMVRKLPIKKVLSAWNQAFKIYQKKKMILVYCIFITLANHGGIMLTYYCSAKAIISAPSSSSKNVKRANELTVKDHLLVVPLMTVIQGVPITPMGAGVLEMSGGPLYDQFLGVSNGADIAMMFHIVYVIVILLGAPFYFFNRKKVEKAVNANQVSTDPNLT